MLGTINQLDRVGGAALGGVVLAIGGFSAVGFFCLIVALLSAAVLQIGMNSNRPADYISLGSTQNFGHILEPNSRLEYIPVAYLNYSME